MMWLWLPGVIWFVLVVAATGLFLSEPRARLPRPDYARIAELERELGIVPSEPEPDVSAWAGRLRGK